MSPEQDSTPIFYPIASDPEILRIADRDTGLLARLESMEEAKRLADLDPKNTALSRVAMFAEENVEYYLETNGYSRTLQPREE